MRVTALRALAGTYTLERDAMATTRFIRWFGDIPMADVGVVGGKNASLEFLEGNVLPGVAGLQDT
jgi:hypothetical protein